MFDEQKSEIKNLMKVTMRVALSTLTVSDNSP